MIYIAVVSHGHFEIINKLGCLKKIVSDSIKVLIVDNIGQSNLKDYCSLHGLDYFYDGIVRGFGTNNNIAFKYLDDKYKFNSGDYFVSMNPDVSISLSSFDMFRELLSIYKPKLSTISLYLDEEFSIQDPCLRNFPQASFFVKSFFGFKTGYIVDKSKLSDDASYVDWSAGSFLCFCVDSYKSLKGFDEKYFMYCEDIDICYRFYEKYGKGVRFFKNVPAFHLCGLKNRKIFSRHFFWHLNSIIRFIFTHRRFR